MKKPSARTFQVESSGDSWAVKSPSLEIEPFQNQQQAIDAAMALAAGEGGTVRWRDEVTGDHVARPAAGGWFSFEVRRARGAAIEIKPLAGTEVSTIV